MIETWILNKLNPLKRSPLIILRDPQRMIQVGARAVDGWAEENGYTVFFTAGNLGLRDTYEIAREDPKLRALLVDRSRQQAKTPLFYPDLQAAVPPRRRLTLSLRDFLIEETGDPAWPPLVNERNLSRLLLAHLKGALRAHQDLRRIDAARFSDSDLYKIVLGAVLNINPFKTLSPLEIRRLCLEQHRALEELQGVLPSDVMAALRQTIARAPAPFNRLLEGNPEQIILAFTLAALMRQHGLEYRILLSNLDPALDDYKAIEAAFLDRALQDQLSVDPERVTADIKEAEDFLSRSPARLAFLLQDRLGLDRPDRALTALKQERLSPLIRGMALLSLLLDLIENRNPAFHKEVIALLDQQAEDPAFLALRQPPEVWRNLLRVYRRAAQVYRLTAQLQKHNKTLQVTPIEDLKLAVFDQLWNREGLNRLDYYTSDLDRMLRVGEILPIPKKDFWPELAQRWSRARDIFKKTMQAVTLVQNQINNRFQDLYRLRYPVWIRRPRPPIIFTHQFLPRLLKAHWNPQSGQKAVVMVFDGLRTDAWDELLRPVLEERFQVIESRPGSALIPTETQLSRKAISAGRLPAEFIGRESSNELKLLQAWLKKNMGLSPAFRVEVDDDTKASGMTARYVSEQLDYIIFSFSDKNLHHNTQDLAFIYNNTVQTIIREDVRSVLRELPANALLFITSDHGFTPVPEKTLTITEDIVADRNDVKYRSARVQALPPADIAPHLVTFKASDLLIPDKSLGRHNRERFQYILFPRAGYTLRRQIGRHTPDPYTHGGVSLAECLIPMVVMGPPQAEQPPLFIKSLRQVGAINEGEPLTLEVTVAPGQIGVAETVIDISFSHHNIPTRREVFSGEEAVYTFRWQPRLDDLTPAEQNAGERIIPVTAILTYRQGRKLRRAGAGASIRIKLKPGRIRRRGHSGLDLIMGKVPKALK